MAVIRDTPASDRPASRSRAATRARLRESGRALFAERGLHGVTTHDIARRAGVASGTFYLHFRDKRELFREIALEAVGALRERLEEARNGSDDPLERLRSHSTALIAFAEENGPLIRILFSGDADAAAVEADVLNALAESLSKGRSERGGVPPGVQLDVLSQAVVGMFARVVAWWVEDPTRASREEVIETLIRIQLSGTQP
jgi:AcrR family transcriptional regulator